MGRDQYRSVSEDTQRDTSGFNIDVDDLYDTDADGEEDENFLSIYDQQDDDPALDENDIIRVKGESRRCASKRCLIGFLLLTCVFLLCTVLASVYFMRGSADFRNAVHGWIGAKHSEGIDTQAVAWSGDNSRSEDHFGDLPPEEGSEDDGEDSIQDVQNSEDENTMGGYPEDEVNESGEDQNESKPEGEDPIMGEDDYFNMIEDESENVDLYTDIMGYEHSQSQDDFVQMPEEELTFDFTTVIPSDEEIIYGNGNADGNIYDSSVPLNDVEDENHGMGFLSEYLDKNLEDIGNMNNKGLGTATFWRISGAHGEAVEAVLGLCLQLILASDMGASDVEDELQDELQVVSANGYHYLNVDTSNDTGIGRAQRLGLVQSGLADIIVVPKYYTDVSSLFDVDNKGVMFTLLSDPIERAIRAYNEAIDETSAHFDENIASLTLEEYAMSDLAEDNLMTRTLTYIWEIPLKDESLNIAKEILGRKCLVGLLDRFEESLDRFENYFGWSWPNSEAHRCQDDVMQTLEDVRLGPESSAWELLAEKNRFDLELYAYAEHLFEEQAVFFRRGRH